MAFFKYFYKFRQKFYSFTFVSYFINIFGNFFLPEHKPLRVLHILHTRFIAGGAIPSRFHKAYAVIKFSVSSPRSF